MRRPLAAFAVLGLALAGCGDGDDEKADAGVPASVPLTLPPTSERILADDPVEVDPDVEPATTASTPTTPTTLRVGLPPDLGIPGAGTISLGSGSSISNRFTVREVAFLEVVAFVAAELRALGWQVQPLPPEGQRVAFTFDGPGAAGDATVEPLADGTVGVRVVLGGRR